MIYAVIVRHIKLLGILKSLFRVESGRLESQFERPFIMHRIVVNAQLIIVFSILSSA